MGVYGVPEEVLTDNGTVFTGRFIKPRPAEVLFERICRENGITQRLTRPRSPTTTGKIERLHQSLQLELLDVHGPFESLAALQAALDAWREEYNSDRPHQSLNMAFPASRFTPAVSPLPLRVPSQLIAASTRQAEQPEPPSAELSAAPAPDGQQAPPVAVEADRVVPPSGNLQLGGQQVWLGPALADRKVTIWVDETSLHVLLDGARVKTLPSRLGITELARLAADGARPAGPSPLRAGTGTVVEVERTVNAAAWSAWQAPSSTSATSWPGSGSSCGWMALRWPSSPVTGNWRGPCRARFPPVTGTGCAVPGRLRLPRSALWPGDGAAAGLLPRRHHGRHPEDPGRPDPRGQDRHRHRRGPQLPAGHRRAGRRRRAPHHRTRDPPVQGLRGAPAPGKAVTTMPELRLDVVDAAELAELLQFLSRWLARDRGRLGASLEEFVGHPAYNIGELRQDLDRFTFLLGGDDGEALFGPDAPEVG